MTQAALTSPEPVETLRFGTHGPDNSQSALEVIRVENLRKTYHLGEVDVPVLHGVSFSIRRGEMVALMGVSGSGKTTLMNILGCLDRPSSGKYWLDGQEMSELSPNERATVRGAKIGFVFQNFNLLARTSALNNVSMPLHYAMRRLSSSESKQWAARLLAHVGLEERLDHEPSQLSGGQQQRVAIARSLVNQPALVLADEPTGNLDSHTSVEILQTFQQLNAAGVTVILVTHDPKVASFAHRTIHLADGFIESDRALVPSALPIPHIVHGALNSNGRGGGNGPANTCSHAASAENTAVNGNLSSHLLTLKPTDLTADTGEVTHSAATLASPSGNMAAVKSITRQVFRRANSTMLLATLGAAATALRRNKLRSGLTTLGIVIGIGAVITMVEIGQGASHAIQQTIASLGGNIVQIDPSGASVGGVSVGTGARVTLTPGDCEAIVRDCSVVQWAAPSVDGHNMQVVYGNRNWLPRNILGTTPAYLKIRDWEDLQEGVPITDDDVLRAACVCLIGDTPARELFQGESPVGKTVRVKNVLLKIVGVLSRKGANMVGMDQDDFFIAPLTTVKLRLSGIRNQTATVSTAVNQVNTLSQLYPNQQFQLYPQPSSTQTADTPQMTRFFDIDDIWVLVSSPEDIPRVMRDITALLHVRHRIQEGQLDDFKIRDLTEIGDVVASTSRRMTILLMCVAAISLLVGGVGIMNIMLVSVKERTREIGLRMAVGAGARNILWQFLVEAVLVCLAGGVAGIVLGRGASIIVSSFLHWPTMPSLPAVIAAVAVSAIVGIAFGYYPAWKASRLDPIEALRYE